MIEAAGFHVLERNPDRIDRSKTGWGPYGKPMFQSNCPMKIHNVSSWMIPTFPRTLKPALLSWETCSKEATSACQDQEAPFSSGIAQQIVEE